MKQLLIASLALFAAACNSHNGGTSSLKTNLDSVSYCIGTDIGRTLHRQQVDVAPEAFLQGLKDASDSSAKKILTDEQMSEVMMAFQQQMISKLSEKNKKEGNAFLAENKTKPGVVTTASGLQYKIITEGKGRKPKITDHVVVVYRGTFLNGMEFDNSTSHGGQVTFLVSQIIPGWTEALQIMPVGSKWQLFVPSNLAYGDNPPRSIPPGSTLIFELELLSIK